MLPDASDASDASDGCTEQNIHHVVRILEAQSCNKLALLQCPMAMAMPNGNGNGNGVLLGITHCYVTHMYMHVTHMYNN